MDSVRFGNGDEDEDEVEIGKREREGGLFVVVQESGCPSGMLQGDHVNLHDCQLSLTWRAESVVFAFFGLHM